MEFTDSRVMLVGSLLCLVLILWAVVGHKVKAGLGEKYLTWRTKKMGLPFEGPGAFGSLDSSPTPKEGD
jgi:hypothetical protein